MIAEYSVLLSKKLKGHNVITEKVATKDLILIIRPRMQTYVTIADFVYMKDQFGRVYSWGRGKILHTKELFGYDFVMGAYPSGPEELKSRIIGYLKMLLPESSANRKTD